MANREKGERSLQIGDEEFTLVYSINALCEVEEKLGMGFPLITAHLSDVSLISLRVVRGALWGGLRTHHPKLTVADVGNLINRYGGLLKILPVMNDAIGQAFPDMKADDGEENPPQPGQGETTGSASATDGSKQAA